MWGSRSVTVTSWGKVEEERFRWAVLVITPRGEEEREKSLFWWTWSPLARGERVSSPVMREMC